MNRPKETDPEVITLALDKLIVSVMEWSRESGCEDEAGVREDLAQHISAVSDGYEFARNLERYNQWACHSQLVEILDDAPSFISAAHREIVRKWIEVYRVYPAHNPGDKITFQGHPAEIAWSQCPHKHSPGCYGIFCESMGHVRSGNGTLNQIIAWEVIDGKVNALGLTITGPLFA